MARVYNFSAGPSMLPEAVLKTAADEMLDYQGSGQSVMEMSHRSKTYDKIIKDACICTETGEGEFTVDRLRVEVIVADEILQGKGKAAVLCEGFDTRNQTGTVTEGAANIRQNDFGSLLFQLDIAALRQ